MSNDRYMLMVVHPRGRPVEVENFDSPAQALRARDRLWNRDRGYQPRRHYYVLDTQDTRHGTIDWDDLMDLVA